MEHLVDGTLITLECQAAIPGPRFLDGTTATGTVQLAPRTDSVFTGTRWQVARPDSYDPVITLACCGTTQGARYLDGRGASDIGLAPDTLAPFAGTRWRVDSAGTDLVTLECLNGNGILNGLTDPSIRSVTLVESTQGPGSSGTRWRMAVVARPSFTVRTTRTDSGATLEFSGSGFTPNDLVRFTAEGVLADGPRQPIRLGGTGRTHPDGAFDGLHTHIDLADLQPNNPAVVVRAIDRHGLTAVSTTDGFDAPSA